MAQELDRAAYAAMFGPTAGDRVRLADTELVIEVEDDCAAPGEEVKFGGGKVLRDGMGQSQATRADGAVDTVITNALILDHWGVVKADVGLRGGRIAAIGKAGNPDVQPGVDIVVGPGTEAIAHQLGHAAAVARALDHEVADQGDRLRVVQAHAARPPPARDLRRHRQQQLVLLAREQVHRALGLRSATAAAL